MGVMASCRYYCFSPVIVFLNSGSARALQLGSATKRVGSAIHWQAFGRNQQKYNELDTEFDMSNDFHVYKLEWTPTSITTFVDDIPILEKNISLDYCNECEELHQPFFFVINLAVGGGYTRIYHERGITANVPADMLVDYIRVYDNGHTELSGSSTITSLPTMAPTSNPTTSPTKGPTESPTMFPTPLPTSKEERDEKPAPTTAEQSPPTLEPTLPPESSPLPTTSSPTNNQQSQTPPTTPSPTVQVTSTSSLPVQRLEAKGVKMALQNVSPLHPMSVQTWSDVTRDFLITQVTTAIGLVDSVSVKVSLASQDPPYVLTRRSLQDDHVTQELTFDADFEIQSVVQVHDANRFIIGAFNTFEKKLSYLTTLEAADDAFMNVSDVVVAPATSVSRVVQNPANDSNNDGMGIGLIVGIVLAALATICLVAALVYSRRRQSSSKSSKQESKSHNSSDIRGESPTAKAYREDDSLYNLPIDTPSTCEDSLYTSPSKGTLDYQFTCPRSSRQPASVVTSDSDFEKYIASFRHKDPEPTVDDSESEFTNGSQTYDYSAAYKNMQGSIADSQSQMTGQVTHDDQTIVAEFEVNAPPGNLGLVLDSSKDGVPVILSVSKSSPLQGQVYTGDRLLSMDGRDMTMVMPQTVTRVINSKKSNPRRTFVFARPMEI